MKGQLHYIAADLGAAGFAWIAELWDWPLFGRWLIAWSA